MRELEAALEMVGCPVGELEAMLDGFDILWESWRLHAATMEAGWDSWMHTQWSDGSMRELESTLWCWRPNQAILVRRLLHGASWIGLACRWWHVLEWCLGWLRMVCCRHHFEIIANPEPDTFQLAQQVDWHEVA